MSLSETEVVGLCEAHLNAGRVDDVALVDLRGVYWDVVEGSDVSQGYFVGCCGWLLLAPSPKSYAYMAVHLVSEYRLRLVLILSRAAISHTKQRGEKKIAFDGFAEGTREGV